MEISRLLAAPLSGNQLEDNAEEQSEGKKWQPHAPAKRKRRWRPSRKQLKDKNQRDADNSLLLHLTLDVNDLRQQVHDCVVQKSIRETRLLVAREQFHARSLQSVDHFFQLFRRGYRSLTPTEEEFLFGLVDENVGVGGGATGRTQFFEQWRRYKQQFQVRRLRNLTSRVVTSDATGGCLIECSGEFEGHVTAAALATVFPSAKEDNALAEQVLHRRFVCPTKTLISIDSRGRLVRYDAFSDVFEAMSKLLDFDPFKVVKLMANAAITDGSMLPHVDDCIDQGEDGGYDADARNQQVCALSGASPVGSMSSSRGSIEFILS
ncbi:WD repeat-containing protein 60 [Phytophthora pseudosyringae]|uniref:WD repeat-containing protein 60 n=1 Tax=Phytophthora pseudosyringae TaxID=221518 RepID=A0A8T1VPB5_9STRA|nr:WD repeat-containing protein 60 [Phytophthora pseudosyringae]